METLPDYIDSGLRILSIGLNPSPPSVAAGYYFAGKQNRFWKALNASGLLAAALEPSPQAMQQLLQLERIGFTDTVKRPTPGAGGLRKGDFRRDLPLLLDLILQYQPAIAWFHGKVAWRHYREIIDGVKDADLSWGLQTSGIGSAQVFVSPNPSPANAVFSLDDLIASYRELAALAPPVQAR
ncbi:mismatch-specific DNA-glycosylase [Granulosicoccaceae sp. 1_MG-2023]|nr:mismatch-specific DNA-glycosylase [Granulosicoccaceae sp. 1_MG-2023]